jgi:hypothetical protein
MTEAKRRFILVPFDRITLGNERNYLVKGLIPRAGMTVIGGHQNAASPSGLSTYACMLHWAGNIAVGVYSREP